MGVKASNAVWEHSKHKGSALLIMLALADWSDDDGVSWPSITKLRKKSRLSERHTIRIIKVLEDTGELAVEHRRNVGNTYTITLIKNGDKMSLIEENKESVIDSDANKSQLLTDTKSQLITDSAESDDPSLTVINTPQAKSARALSATANTPRDSASASEDNDDDIIEWFNDKKQAEIESGVRSPAVELPKVPRTADDIKSRVRAAVIENAKRNEEEDRNPVIESYLATVPEHVRKLASVFCYHKKRPPLKKENSMWRREWQDQFDIGISAENVEDAIKYMGMNNLSVRSPMSTLTVAENIRLGHIELEYGMGVKSGEVSYDLPGTQQAETVSEEEVSPMDELIGDGVEEEEGEKGREGE